MSPLQLIKRGIQSGDWYDVLTGYQNLTGEKLDHPNKDEIIEKEFSPPFLDSNDSHEEKTRDSDDFSMPKTNKVREDGKRAGRKEPIDKERNKTVHLFVDDLSEETELLKENAVLKAKLKSGEIKREPRRPPLKMAQAECVKCNKQYKVHPTFVVDGSFTCNKCLGTISRRNNG